MTDEQAAALVNMFIKPLLDNGWVMYRPEEAAQHLAEHNRLVTANNALQAWINEHNIAYDALEAENESLRNQLSAQQPNIGDRE